MVSVCEIWCFKYPLWWVVCKKQMFKKAQIVRFELFYFIAFSNRISTFKCLVSSIFTYFLIYYLSLYPFVKKVLYIKLELNIPYHDQF